MSHRTVYLGFAALAGVLAVVGQTGPHRLWGAFAVVAYLVAAAVGKDVVAFVGAALLPMAVLVALGSGQEEVSVVRRSAETLLAHGTPYRAVSGGDYSAYNPYLPGMSLFGLGVDPRLLFAAVFLGVLLAWRVHPLVLASPLVAMPIAVGGDDLPVIGLSILGLALARQRPGAAGLVLGFAAVLKATAWPALVIGLLLTGRRGVLPALGVLAVGLAPVLVDPSAFVTNAVLFPLGLTDARSPAASPLPGHLLAGLGPFGHAAALLLLVVAAAGVGLSLLVKPPADAVQAARRLAVGLGLAVLLMPATRWGYLIYPLVLAAWSYAPVRTKESTTWVAA